MTTTTTQSNFSAMRGHVAEGVTVRMESGEQFVIRSDMRGWRIEDQTGKQVSDSNLSAFGVECFIVSRT